MIHRLPPLRQRLRPAEPGALLAACSGISQETYFTCLKNPTFFPKTAAENSGETAYKQRMKQQYQAGVISDYRLVCRIFANECCY
jgi:hypothetical protein